MSNNIGDIKEAVVSGKHKEIESLVKAAINEGTNLKTIINNAMIAAMDIVGQKFADNEIYIPEMLVSAITMKKGLALITPLLVPEEIEANGTIIMCTVKGDLHDIGKNLVIMMLEGAGYDVIDLGVDLPVNTRFAEEIGADGYGKDAAEAVKQARMLIAKK